MVAVFEKDETDYCSHRPSVMDQLGLYHLRKDGSLYFFELGVKKNIHYKNPIWKIIYFTSLFNNFVKILNQFNKNP